MWRAGLTVERKLPFQMSPVLCGQGLTQNMLRSVSYYKGDFVTLKSGKMHILAWSQNYTVCYNSVLKD